MTNIFNIKKQDTLPKLAVTLQYNDGTPIDLTGGSVFFHMGNLQDYSYFYSGTAEITNASNGNVQYSWLGSPDTFVTGNYWGEFRVE